ncbi:hypothetical protein BC628DRAFT_231679 [Trametes gibbosa]|nr:hypothetical protein BC628DRAFT_231679 [Trametes gibbosa]
MLISPPMGRYAEQDYYPPLASSRSRSPRSPSPTRSPSSRSLSQPHSLARSEYAARRSPHVYPYRASHVPPAPPTSIPLDDNFDAPTTAAPSEWGAPTRSGRNNGREGEGSAERGGSGGSGDGHPEYDESVTGYQNYVVEMERMLEGQMESAARAQERVRDAVRERDRGRKLEGERAREREIRERELRARELKERELREREDMHVRERSPVRQRRPSVSVAGTSMGLGRRASTSPVALRRIETSIVSDNGGKGRRNGAHAYTPMSPPPLPMQSPLPVQSPAPDNARQISGKKGRLELVEQHVLEDTAARTISLWRERVAASSVGGSAIDDGNGGQGQELGQALLDDTRSDAGSHVHRRMPSGSMNGDPRMRRVVSDHQRYPGSLQGGGESRNGSQRATNGGKGGRTSYERSEINSASKYIVSYNTAKGGLFADMLPGAPTERDGGSIMPPRELRTPSSPTTNRTYDRPPASPTLRRHAARKSMDRSEFMVSYPNTPPLTGSQASSGSPTGKHLRGLHASSGPLGSPLMLSASLRSPLHGSFRDMREALPMSPVVESDTGVLKAATTTSSVEGILAACDPSLLHIAPVLHELGIVRVDHLRAVARLSEETRDREVKEQALRRGVSVVEWAIFLDKLQTL